MGTPASKLCLEIIQLFESEPLFIETFKMGCFWSLCRRRSIRQCCQGSGERARHLIITLSNNSSNWILSSYTQKIVFVRPAGLFEKSSRTNSCRNDFRVLWRIWIKAVGEWASCKCLKHGNEIAMCIAHGKYYTEPVLKIYLDFAQVSLSAVEFNMILSK